MTYFKDIAEALINPTAVIILVVFFIIINNWLFKRSSSFKPSSIAKNSLFIFILVFGGLALVLSLPVGGSTKGQILSFLGIVLSAGIALSSTTLLGNMIAGFMNNTMNRFRIGDLIKIGEHQGRLTNKSLFHTEIQLEDSNFITIPHLYIANNPVKLTRKTNTVLSASVSLGYDVSRVIIEDTLKSAALNIGLKDPYVYITELGDYSVVYKIHGFLEDSGKFFSTSSLLKGAIMDALHYKNIEIVSPTFMNQRRVENQEFIPAHQFVNTDQSEFLPEELIFDEAIKSEEIEKQKDLTVSIESKLRKYQDKLKASQSEEEKKSIQKIISRYETLKERIDRNISPP
ncbi:MAG: mechanosensitive ion channel [Planctomycetes bacterium]|nr:mechanosensitive ion channel [Planctomycetota bacterium]